MLRSVGEDISLILLFVEVVYLVFMQATCQLKYISVEKSRACKNAGITSLTGESFPIDLGIFALKRPEYSLCPQSKMG